MNAGRFSLLCTLLVPACLALGLLGDAEANVVVMSFQGHDAAKVRSAVSAALESSGHSVTPGDTSFDDAAVLIGCDPKSDACAEEVLSTLSIDEAVFGSSTKSGEITISRIERGKPRRQAKVKLEPGQSLPAAVTPAVQKLYDEPSARPAAVADPPPPPSSEPAVERIAKRPVSGRSGRRGAAELSASEAGGSRPYRTWAIVSWSGAGVAAMAGLLFWVNAGDLQDDIDRAPTDTQDDLNALRDLEDRAEASSDWGNAMMVVGAGLAGVGTYLWVKDRRSQRTSSARAALAPSISPSLFPGGGAGLVLTFGGKR